jgi:hypothetical protein
MMLTDEKLIERIRSGLRAELSPSIHQAICSIGSTVTAPSESGVAAV